MVVLLHLVATGLACPGPGGATAEAAAPGEKCPPPAPGQAVPDPAHCATRTEVVGAEACAWTTEVMAQRVLEEGSPWTFVGHLVPTTNALPSKVAAPYAIGPEDARVFVIGNQIVESLTISGTQDERLELSGRRLEVNGTVYFVATHAATRNS